MKSTRRTIEFGSIDAIQHAYQISSRLRWIHSVDVSRFDHSLFIERVSLRYPFFTLRI